MNRYRSGGPSKATPTTLCQKCLKKGHYTYECSTSQQDRPYLSRPSRSQQLSNPKLAPKLSSTLPPTDAKPAQKAEAKGKAATSEVPTSPGRSVKDGAEAESRRRRSVSSYSSGSVSSYSTNRSKSRSRTPPRASETRRRRQDESVDRSPSPPPGRHRRSPSLDRRDSEASRRDQQPAREDTRKRAPRDRSRSPAPRVNDGGAGYRRRSGSRSPYRGAKEGNGPSISQRRAPLPPRERSMSPYSQRLALTKAMDGSVRMQQKKAKKSLHKHA